MKIRATRGHQIKKSCSSRVREGRVTLVNLNSGPSGEGGGVREVLLSGPSQNMFYEVAHQGHISKSIEHV